MARSWAVVVSCLLATVLGAGPSIAAPGDAGPAAATARDIARIEVRLAELKAAQQDAEVLVAQAGEAYARALTGADKAAAEASDLAGRAATAAQGEEQAWQDLMALARQMQRSGGHVGELEAVLYADGVRSVARRSEGLERLSRSADQTQQEFRAAHIVATTLTARANASTQAAQQQATAARDALAAATAAYDSLQQKAAAADTERAALVAQLAAARHTSVRAELARQAELDRDAAARATAQAQAASRATPSTSQPPGPPPAKTVTPAAPAPTPTPSSTTPPPAPAPTPPATAPPTTTPDGLGTGRSRGSAAQGAAAVAAAKQRLGLPYVWGGVGPDGFDCSGLTMTAWRDAGVNLNRTSRDQYKQVLKISYDDLRPGDLLFWSTDATDPDEIYHVAMWAGAGQIIEAPTFGKPVRITTMRWGSTMPFAGRP